MAKYTWNPRQFAGTINHGGPKEDPTKKAIEEVCRHLTLRPDSVKKAFGEMEHKYGGYIYRIYDDDGPRDASYLTIMVNGVGAKRVTIYAGFHGEAKWNERF